MEFGPEPVDPVDRVVWCERVIARATALQAEAIVEAAGAQRQVEVFPALDFLTGREREVAIVDAAREEIAAALRIAPVTAQGRIEDARLLCGPLAATREALAAGEVFAAHVRVIVDAADRLDGRWRDQPGDAQEHAEFAERCARLQERVLPVAKRGTAARVRACARRAVLAIDPDGQARRRAAATCTRDVYVIDDLDGISTLIARLATVDARAILATVQAAAADRDESTAGERRAGALRDLVLAEADLTIALDVVVTLPTMLGLGDEPAALAGTGAIAFEELRDLLADPSIGVTLRRLVTDPLTGHLLDRGRTAYVVPAALRAFITARDRHCRFPGCRRKAITCQIDHATAWDDGGTTDRCNLGPLCQRHHNLKTHGGWTITESAEDGNLHLDLTPRPPLPPPPTTPDRMTPDRTPVSWR